MVTGLAAKSGEAHQRAAEMKCRDPFDAVDKVIQRFQGLGLETCLSSPTSGNDRLRPSGFGSRAFIALSCRFYRMSTDTLFRFYLGVSDTPQCRREQLCTADGNQYQGTLRFASIAQAHSILASKSFAVVEHTLAAFILPSMPVLKLRAIPPTPFFTPVISDIQTSHASK
jgi:hypothetical protein